MARVYNFSAGPAALPQPVLEQVREELLDWRGTGASVMELSHRGGPFREMAEKAEADLRELLAIPSHYRVLFLAGGAQTQFSLVPLNLLDGRDSADYVVTGHWSQIAKKEGERYCRANLAATAEADGFSRVPQVSEWRCNPHAAYLHVTPNETIHGVAFDGAPRVEGATLVADMTSCLLSQPLDVERFGLIYAGTQKNIGPAGITVVIVREDLLGRAHALTPKVLDFRRQADAGSMANTPPTFVWYVCALVLEWLKGEGGLTVMETRNRRKAERLYRSVDESDGFYRNPVEARFRSRMNLPFTLADPTLDDAFLRGAAIRGLHALKGHRAVGGMRASLYNAMPEAGVDALVAFMNEFRAANG